MFEPYSIANRPSYSVLSAVREKSISWLLLAVIRLAASIAALICFHVRSAVIEESSLRFSELRTRGWKDCALSSMLSIRFKIQDMFILALKLGLSSHDY